MWGTEYLPLLAAGGLLALVFFINDDDDDDHDDDGVDQPIDNDDDDDDSATGPWPSGTGTAGNDTIYGDHTVHDYIDAGAGDDAVYGGARADTLIGGPGNDTLDGGSGRDVLYDIEGNNVLNGSLHADRLTFNGGSIATGGEGADTFSIVTDPDAEEPAKITDYVEGVDRISEIVVTTSDEEIGKLVGRDWKTGEGTDLFLGDDAIAHVKGGQDMNVDKIRLTAHVDADVVSDYHGNTTIYAEGEDQEIYARHGRDLIFGHTDASDSVDDLYHGGVNNDTIVATVDEQANVAPQLFGDGGNDVLIGENGAIMTGGTGADEFVTQASSDRAVEVTDFDEATDIITVEASDGQNTDVLRGQITVETWADDTGADVLVGGHVVAKVVGGQNLTAANINVVAAGQAY